MVDLLNKKIFLDKDEKLFRKIEQLAFSQGFVYVSHWNRDRNSPRIINQKPIIRAKYQNVVFLESLCGTYKVISLNHYCDKNKVISSHYTHKDRFDNIKSWKYNSWYKNCIIEELDPKLLKFKTMYELW